MLESLKEFLEKVNRLALVSGYEEHHLSLFVNIVKEFVGRDVEVVDRNIIIEGKNPTFSAHYDEIGYVVDNAYDWDLYRTIPVGLNEHERGYGKILRTLLNGEEILGIGSSPMPHVNAEEKRLFIHLFEKKHIPPLWPFTFDGKVILSGDKLFSRALDDRLGVFVALMMAKEGYSVVLWAGEELGTTRVMNVVDRFDVFVELDTIFSAKDVHAPYGVDDGKIAHIRVEGAGRGNVAPENLADAIRDITTEIKTTSPYEITTATTIYRFGGKAISLLAPIYYFHSSKEMVKRETVEAFYEVALEVARRLE